jgi:peptide/nickel transport system substrate-binding protein
MRAVGPLSVGAAIAAALTLSACWGGDHASTTTGRAAAQHAVPKHGGTLTMLWRDDADSLDPGITYSVSGTMVTRATQRTLLSFRPADPTHPIADLAAALPDISPDGRSMTVRLRPGVRFSPPVDREVTSADVKYAIERGFFRSVANPYVSIYFADLVGAKVGAPPGTRIPGIETPDARTVVFHLTDSTARVMAGGLVLPLSAPVPRDYALPYDRKVQSTYARHQVATGPYMVELDARGLTKGYRAGRSIHLVRNPNWRAATDFRPAYLDDIEIREGNGDATAATRRILVGHGLVSGDFNPPPAELKRTLAQRRDQMALPLANFVRYVALNTKLPPFDDIDVRKAVVAAFDRDAMRLARGGAAVASIATHFIPPGTPGYEEAGGARGPGYDFLADPRGQPELAARYMRKAGYRSGRYEGSAKVLTVGATGGNDEPAAEIAQATLERLGFKVKLRLVSFVAMYTTFCGTPSADVQVCPDASWYRDFADGQTILDPTFNGKNILTEGNSNISQLDVPAINTAMARARRVVDPAARARAWGAVDRMVTAQAAAVPLSWDRYPLVRSKDVRGVVAEHLALWDPTFTSLR